MPVSLGEHILGALSVLLLLALVLVPPFRRWAQARWDRLERKAPK